MDRISNERLEQLIAGDSSLPIDTELMLRLLAELVLASRTQGGKLEELFPDADKVTPSPKMPDPGTPVGAAAPGYVYGVAPEGKTQRFISIYRWPIYKEG